MFKSIIDSDGHHWKPGGTGRKCEPAGSIYHEAGRFGSDQEVSRQKREDDEP